MSKSQFILSYKQSDLKTLSKFASVPDFLPIKTIISYIIDSYARNYDLCECLIKILVDQYESKSYIKILTDEGETDLVEIIIRNNIKLSKSMISYAATKGRICIMKIIYDVMNPDKHNQCKNVNHLLSKHNIIWQKTENTLDSFVWAIVEEEEERFAEIITYVNPSLWDNWAIKYAVKNNNNNTILDILLRHPSVDPSSGGNYSLKICIKESASNMANKLLKHPLVGVEELTYVLIYRLINSDCLCSIKKIIKYGNDETKELLQNVLNEQSFEDISDTIYYCGKMGLCDYVQIDNNDADEEYDGDFFRNSSYIQNNVLMGDHVDLPYDQMLDPHEIFEQGLRDRDMDQINKLKNLLVSISCETICGYIFGPEDDLPPLLSETIFVSEEEEMFNDYVLSRIFSDYSINNIIYKLLYQNPKFDILFKKISDFGIEIDFDSLCTYLGPTKSNVLLDSLSLRKEDCKRLEKVTSIYKN